MDMGHFNLFIKMIQEEYKLSEMDIQILTRRMLADGQEFEKVWKQYKNKSKNLKSGDGFRILLDELLS